MSPALFKRYYCTSAYHINPIKCPRGFAFYGKGVLLRALLEINQPEPMPKYW